MIKIFAWIIMKFEEKKVVQTSIMNDFWVVKNLNDWLFD